MSELNSYTNYANSELPSNTAATASTTATTTTTGTATATDTPSSISTSTFTSVRLADEGALTSVTPPPIVSSTTDTVIPYVVKTARPNSKLILQNMEEVLNSVKEKHRQKHRRKKEQKKLARMEAIAAAAAAGDIGPASPTSTVQELSKQRKHDKIHHHHHRHHHHGHGHHHHSHSHSHSKKKPLQEKLTHDNGVCNTNGNTKESTSSDNAMTPNDVKLSDELRTVPRAPTNAFEVMMNARNRSIGMNSPGKDATVPSNGNAPDELAEARAGRKQLLQEWAERKGGAKRRLDDEARALYVEKQLENRAKRFKKMLVGGGGGGGASPKVTGAKETMENGVTSADDAVLPAQSDACLESPNTRKRGKRRQNCVQHIDDTSDSSSRTATGTADSETIEFLAKLSSPTKKRDSLLGYFPKRESPSASGSKTPKSDATVHDGARGSAAKRTRRSKVRGRTLSTTEASVATPTQLEVVESTTPLTPPLQTTTAAATIITTTTTTTMETEPELIMEKGDETPGGRPRRSCVGKPRYDGFIEGNVMRKSSRRQKVEVPTTPTTTTITDDVVETIDLDDSLPDAPAEQTPKKLAPLFTRLLVRPSPDPNVLRARKEFLHSGVPEKLRLERAKQKQYEQIYEESDIFPRISHIRQLDEAARESLDFGEIRLPVNLAASSGRADDLVARKSKPMRTLSTLGAITTCTSKDFRLISKLPASGHRSSIHSLAESLALTLPLPSLPNKRLIIKDWKVDYERFPTYRCYNQMREKYRHFSAIDSAQATEQVSESLVVTRQTRRHIEAVRNFNPDAAEEEPPPSAPNGELLFTEKYRPLLLEQVLVNLTPVMQLREFLANWAPASGTGSGRSSQQQDMASILNDSSSNTNQSNCNAVVLLGPVSSGKTSSVFALANNMNFNVLEINAGMKRTGKKLIQELQEATQSHQIRKESSLRRPLNGLKSKMRLTKSLSEDGNGLASELSYSARKSLILIEDADIVFEQTDAGFIDAIYTLVASSKRPVIVVASDPHCGHLQRLMAQNTIRYEAPSPLNISRYLSVLSLIENCPVNLDDLISLYLFNRRDVRRTLLELQFFVQSGGDHQRNGARLHAAQRRQLGKQSQQNQQNQQCQSDGKRFFASPTKADAPTEEGGAQMPDERLDRKARGTEVVADGTLYMHRSLFEFYTCGQNEKHRTPFPLDFQLLSLNLADIKRASRRLLPQAAPTVVSGSKRKSRSPRKSNGHNNSATGGHSSHELDVLAQFYENISVSAKIDGPLRHCVREPLDWFSKDRLRPNLSEEIAHTLVENAIDVNLAAEPCPYNLFHAPTDKHPVLTSVSSARHRTGRARHLDYEPILRNICRTEKLRATQERRSTRFYHYLRNMTVNLPTFSTEPFDNVCSILSPSVESEAAVVVAATAFGNAE